jgi:hypothetical protein
MQDTGSLTEEQIAEHAAQVAAKVDNRVVVDFGRDVRRVNLRRQDAIALANSLKAQALLCKP